MTKFPSHKTHDPQDPFEMPSVEGLEPNQAAKALAGYGLKIFPCWSNRTAAKRPILKGWPEKATNDPEQVQKWWQANSSASIGLLTGDIQLPETNFAVIVIDVDCKGDVDGSQSLTKLEAEISTLPETFTVQTPSGGFHYYFTIPKGLGICNSASKIGSGIDIRCNRGYVIGPGSVLEGRGRYNVISEAPIAELPQTWIDLVQNGRNAPYPNVPHQPNSPMDYGIADFGDEAVNDNLENGRSAYGDNAFRSEIDNVIHAAPGTRNDMLNTAAFSLGQLVGAGHLQEAEVRAALFKASAVNHLVRDDGEETVLATIESGVSSGIKKPRPDLPFTHQGAQLTEDILAIEFAMRFSERFRFNHNTGKWMYWNDTFWEVDETSRSLETVRQMIRPYTSRKGCRHLGKTAASKSVLAAAASDRMLSTRHDDWNKDPWLLGTPGGYVNLKTGKFLKPDPTKLISQITSVDPCEGEPEHPLWSTFLYQATKGDKELRRFLQQLVGYCLTGMTNEEKFFFFHGHGGNGKGVFLSTITGILGNYSHATPMQTFAASRNDGHPTEMAALHEARLVTASEIEEFAKLRVSRIKELTGNETPIAARFMHRDFFEFKPCLKLWLVGNNKPELGTIDDAWERRLKLIPFEHKPEKPDMELKEKLKTEYSAILRWAIQGCLDWQKSGLIIPRVVKEASEQYLNEEDHRLEWYKMRIKEDANVGTINSELHRDWQKWASDKRLDAGTQSATTQWLSRRNLKQGQKDRQRATLGIKLWSTDDFDD